MYLNIVDVYQIVFYRTLTRAIVFFVLAAFILITLILVIYLYYIFAVMIMVKYITNAKQHFLMYRATNLY